MKLLTLVLHFHDQLFQSDIKNNTGIGYIEKKNFIILELYHNFLNNQCCKSFFKAEFKINYKIIKFSFNICVKQIYFEKHSKINFKSHFL